MDPNQENHVTPPQSQEETARQARRRLLKVGAVGAPLILTFRGTSAWAVSSGCIIGNGTKPIPGNITKVDTNMQPIPVQTTTTTTTTNTRGRPQPPQNSTPVEYQTIFISEKVGDPATASIDNERLRALVYNNNIGQTCLMSIAGF